MAPQKMTVTEIKQINREKGCHFFDRDTMRFFCSRVHGPGYRFGESRVLFVTSEQFVDDWNGYSEPRKYTVRIMDLDTGTVDEIGKFQEYASLLDARAALHLKYWKGELAAAGYEDAEIAFSGFWSQGDGASFTGGVNLTAWIAANAPQEYRHLIPLLDRCLIDPFWKITRFRWGNYVHDNLMEVQTGGNDLRVEHKRLTTLLERLERAVLEDAKERARKIYAALKDDYEGETSEESVADRAHANNWLFDAQGNVL